MPITLTIMPGHREKSPGYAGKVLELFGPALGRETVSVEPKVTAIAAVTDLSKRMHEANPDASFQVLVSLRRGQRKPNGFNSALIRNGFGQDNYLRLVSEPADHDAQPPAT